MYQSSLGRGREVIQISEKSGQLVTTEAEGLEVLLYHHTPARIDDTAAISRGVFWYFSGPHHRTPSFPVTSCRLYWQEVTGIRELMMGYVLGGN